MTGQRIVMWLMALAIPAHTAGQTRIPATPSAVLRVTIDELVARALDSAPALRAERLAIDRARSEVQQASLRGNPTISTERRDEAGGTDNMTSVMVAWPLEPFRRGARVATAAAQLGVTSATVDEAERQLAGEVRRRAGALLAAERRAVVTDDIAGSFRETYESLARRAEEGAVAPLLRDQAYVEWQRFEAQRPSRRAEVKAAAAELCAVVGLPIDTSLAVADDLSVLSQRPLPAPAADDRADVRRASAALISTTAQVDQARQMGRFDLGVFGGYTRMNSGFPQFGVNSDGARTPIGAVFHNLSIGVSVTVPIANRNQGAVAAARFEQRAAEFRRDAVLLQASAEIVVARARDGEARAAVQIYDGGLRSIARKNLDVVRESFSLGRLALADVFSEQRRHLDVEMGYIDALSAAFLARADLLQALGVTR